MKLKTKIALVILATLITLVGFNLVLSPGALELLKAGRAAQTGMHYTITVIG